VLFYASQNLILRRKVPPPDLKQSLNDVTTQGVVHHVPILVISESLRLRRRLSNRPIHLLRLHKGEGAETDYEGGHNSRGPPSLSAYCHNFQPEEIPRKIVGMEEANFFLNVLKTRENCAS